MSEVPLYTLDHHREYAQPFTYTLQGYLTFKMPNPPRTLQQDHA